MASINLRLLKPSTLKLTLTQHKPVYVLIKADGTIGNGPGDLGTSTNDPNRGFANSIHSNTMGLDKTN
jgi:hypothetical protein